jgi:parallel beta-helix repeat protein
MKKYFTSYFNKICNAFLLGMIVFIFGTLHANAQISVTATAGTLGPTTYTTMHAAFDAINAGTHQGVINIAITTSGTITETLTDTLIQSGSGSAVYTSVTIKPATGVTATISSAIATNGPIFLYGASNVTIDGSNTVGGTTQDLTIKNTSAGYVVRMGTPSASSACSGITIKNCIMTGGGVTSGVAAIVSDGGTTVGGLGLTATNNVTIQNNSISNANRAVETNGPAAMDQDWTITGNTFSNCWGNGVLIKNGQNTIISNNTISAPTSTISTANSIGVQITTGQSVTISNNIITGFSSGGSISVSGSGTYIFTGIYVTNVQSINIDSNSVTGPTVGGGFSLTASSITVCGIYVNSSQTVTVNGNTVSGPTTFTLNGFPVSGIELTATITGANVYDNHVATINNPGTGGAYGIFIDATGTGSNINVYNNFVADISGKVGGTVSNTGQGIYMDQGDAVNIYHNSIDMSVDQPSATSGSPISADICFNPTGTISNINVTDNILVNTETLGTPYAIYCGSASSIFTTIDYNDYYATSGNLGYIGSTGYTTIAGVQTGFGGNVNSINFDPSWISTTDLHLIVSSTNAPLNAGVFITTPSITTDIDGDARVTPTIGADELILCAGTITGTASVCVGTTTALTDATTGGIWSSSSTAIATVSATGVVYGVAAGTVTISYTTTCTVTRVVTVGTLPITGTTTVCSGATITLSDATTGGVWSSSNSGVATISATGVVYGTTAGTTNISYTFGSCTPVGMAITVVTLGPITGTPTVCAGSTSPLSNATAGGVWSSSNPGVATVSGGVVYGVTAGTVNISYTVGLCSVGVAVTVGTMPITGGTTICTGSTSALSDATPGGVWSSGNTGVATVSAAGVVYGVSNGTATIYYTFGSCTPVSVTVTVTALAAITPATATVCVGSATSLSDATTGGVWSTGSGAIATVSGSGVVTGASAGTTTIIYTLGSCTTSATVTVSGTLGPITGSTTVCVGSSTGLTDATPGGAWSSSNTPVATVVSGTGVVWGASAGTANISYTVGGCSTDVTVTVVTLPAITGPTSVCVGSTITLSDAATGGAWSSGTTTAATISGGGVVTGVASGSTTIYYTVGSCSVSQVVTVGTAIAPITGTPTLCAGATTSLSDATPGGVWSSDNTPVATVSGTVTVYGASPGTANISYTVGGCSTDITVTVSPSNAGTITGKDSVCVGPGHVITLSDNVSGGVWSSSNTTDATVDPVTGVVTGVHVGTTVTIRYVVTSSCGTYTATYVVHVRTAAQCATGVEPLAEGDATILKVFPNPNGGMFTMNLLSSEADEEVHVVVTNILGEKVREFITTTNKAVEIKLDQAAGIYLLSASTEHGRYIAKIVVD